MYIHPIDMKIDMHVHVILNLLKRFEAPEKVAFKCPKIDCDICVKTSIQYVVTTIVASNFNIPTQNLA